MLLFQSYFIFAPIANIIIPKTHDTDESRKASTDVSPVPKNKFKKYLPMGMLKANP